MNEWTNRELDRDDFERWRRIGRERGWFQRAAEEARSWLDDEEERRRINRERMAMPERDRERLERFERMQRDRFERDRERMERERERYGLPAHLREAYTPEQWRFIERPRMSHTDWESEYGHPGRPREHLSPWDREHELLARLSEATIPWEQRLRIQRESCHYGRGPKTYQRSDERIRDEINERLTRHSEVDAREIEVEVRDGEVMLKGNCEDRYSKRIAEDLAEDVFGVKQVHNQLRVLERSKDFGREREREREREMAGTTPTRK